ncbi:MAG: TonB-dependent receptor, partial [Ignavibacteriales bacterium]|nr:TonB-dependent receptor [Ignavibacteriales bacterium]
EHILGVYDYRQYAYTRYLFGFGGPLGKDPNLLKFYFSGEYKRNPTRLPTPEKIQITQNYILNLTFQPSNEHKFKLKGSFKQYKGGIWSGSSDIRYAGLAFTPPGVSKKYLIAFDPVREEQNIEQSLNWTYTINNNSFLEAILTHQTEKYELAYRYLAGFGMIVDRLDFYDDPNGTVLRNGPWWEDKYYFPPQSFSTNYYQDNRSNNWVLKSDYTSQISESNLFKAGINFSYFELFNNGVNSSFQPNSYVARNGFAEYYTAYPISLSAYVQDRMEYEGMIANFGVRAEAFNYQTGVPLDKFNVLYTGTDGPSTTNIGDPSTENSKTQYILLPRIGVSFPIGENTAFRFHYGHFASMPIFSQALARRTWRGWNTIGNPNLEPKLTINYEVGIQQVIGDNHRLDLALYYNDRTKQVGTQQVASYTGCALYSAGFSNDGTPLYWYNTFVNNIFGSTVGLEVIFETITATNWSYRLSYSLSQTTVGSFGARGVYPDGTRGYATRDYTGEFLASWDRTHNLRALVNYFIKENEGPEIFGIKILENTSISMSYTAQSGNPYTYVTEYGLIDVINNRRYPIETNVDLSISKDIKVDDMRLIFQVRVMNVFDNKILTPLADSYEIADWVENNITYEDPGNDPTRLSYIVAPYRKYLNIPRQIFFTLGIGF